MPIFEWNMEDHGWAGLRVARSVAGTKRLRYFSFHAGKGALASPAEQEKIRKAALELDQAWARDQAEARSRRHSKAPDINNRKARHA